MLQVIFFTMLVLTSSFVFIAYVVIRCFVWSFQYETDSIAEHNKMLQDNNSYCLYHGMCL